MFLNGLFLFCSVIPTLYLFCLMNQDRTKGEVWSIANLLKLFGSLVIVVGQGQGQQAVVFSDRGQMFQFFIDFFEL